MARLNISIPQDLAPLVRKWRRKLNLSEICASVLRDELAAVESHRSALPILRKLRRPNPLELELVERFELHEAWVSNGEESDERQIRETLGKAAAEYLNQNLSEGCVLAIGGGRQAWCIVEHMSPRQIAMDIVALGYRQNDPNLLNAHPNTLATVLWLLFSPRAKAWLIGNAPNKTLNASAPVASGSRYFVVGSCAPFEAGSSLARLLGASATKSLVSRKADGDFLYNFFNNDGLIIDLEIPGDRSILSASELGSLCERPDTKVVLVAGGEEKAGIIRKAVEAKLCNVLITETTAAQRLLGEKRPMASGIRSSRSAARS